MKQALPSYPLRTAMLAAALALCPFAAMAQNDAREDDTTQTASVPLYVEVGKMPYGGDSIFHIITPTLSKYPKPAFASNKQREEYNRLVRNVKKVLPIAKLIRHTIIETYDYLETLPDEKSRSAHISSVEKGLRRQYTPMMKKLSYSQGKLLIKLIDRECNQTSFDMVVAFIGPFRAGAYQVFAGLFGASLKKHYDPEGEDRMTERVVRMIESGQL